MTRPARTVVIGIGNEFRGDDGVGPAVLARLTGRLPAGVDLLVSDGEPANLLDAWDGASVAIVVDAVQRACVAPGTLCRMVIAGPDVVAGGEPGPEGAGASGSPGSSHGLGLGSAIGLARVLGRLPARLILHGVQGGDFSLRVGLSRPVAGAINDLVTAVVADLPGRSGEPGDGTDVP